VVRVGAIIWIAAFGSFIPGGTSAVPLSVVRPVAAAQFTSDIRYHQGLLDPITVSFGSTMDHASVESALGVTPATPVSLSWNVDSTVLTLAPTNGWRTGTYYTIAIAKGAHDVHGQSLTEPARTVFLTRPATNGMVIADRHAGQRVTTTTSFTVAFERAVDVTAAEAALQIEPAVPGAFSASGDSRATGFSFVPFQPLAADTTYVVRLNRSVLDDDGAPVAMPAALRVRTAVAPSVVRFRPLNGATNVPRAAIISVRFSDPMRRASTAAALGVTAGAKAVTGKISWAEGDSVLVFDPAKNFGYSDVVQVSVGATAKSRDGIPLAAAKTGSFKVEAKRAKEAATRRAVPISRGSGSTAGRATWYAVEAYYLKLMNCTRTRGWVTSSGSCSSPGGLSTPPIILDSGISSRVSRPYARLLASRNICSHFADGDPTTRLRRAGYSGWAAENIGCRSASNAYASVLGTHLYYQTEKPCSGYCHYANLMNPAYKRCGIGVWVYSGRIRLVIDFYHP